MTTVGSSIFSRCDSTSRSSAARSKSSDSAASAMRSRILRSTSSGLPSRKSSTSSIIARVLGLRLREDARRLAPPDVVVEAGPVGHLLRHVVVARPDGEEPLHHVERAPHGADVGVRPEVARAVVLQPARHPDARKRLLHRDLDVRIRLVVAQRDVEARLVLLDQVGLEDERMRLARHDDRVERLAPAA